MTTLRLLRDGDTTGNYPSQSELAMSLAVRFRNHGRTYDEYEDAMTDVNNAASRWYRELRDGRQATDRTDRKSKKGAARAKKELARCWDKAGRLPAPRDLDISDVHERCESVWAFSKARITGRTRVTRLAVLEVVLKEARNHRTVQVLAPERSVAEKAGMCRRTARVSLQDLVQMGALSRAQSDTDGSVFSLEICTHKSPDFLTPLGRGKSGDIYEHKCADSYLAASRKKRRPPTMTAGGAAISATAGG
ncbi:MAG: hypothetical protein M3454_16865 [Actinomycetota bacterium]|nr:hypothetical protein [Actinomycetota bacterium]